MSVKGMRQLQNRLRAIEHTAPMLRTIQLETIAEAKRLVPRKTGHLARSILPGTVTATSAIIEARTPYAAAVEFGAKPHIIRPRRARVLAWPATSAGRRLSGRARTGRAAGPIAFAMVVHHPGNKPHPYLIPAAKHAIARHGLRDTIVKEWNDAA